MLPAFIVWEHPADVRISADVSKSVAERPNVRVPVCMVFFIPSTAGSKHKPNCSQRQRIDCYQTVLAQGDNLTAYPVKPCSKIAEDLLHMHLPGDDAFELAAVI